MAETMGPNLGANMRIGLSNNGAWGECDFYGVSSCRSGIPKGSRNFVQSFTNMASSLSEAGFHTNPTQNQRNMNAEWKRLEAQAIFWTILDYHGLAHPPDHIATGIVSNAESGMPINGAVVTVGGQTYTTDTYASLFNQYSSDPNLLRNGFYYLEDLAAGTLDITVSAEDYAPFTGQVTMLDGELTFFDVQLVSTIPPTLTATSPEPDQSPFRITDPIVLDFSRPMDRAATEAAFALDPSVAGVFVWSESDTRLTFTPAEPLQPQTTYTLTLAATALGAYGDPFDGDGDGTGGDAFALSFTTGFPDTVPPGLVASYPAPNASGVARRPVITVTYSEPVDPSTLEGRVGLERTSDLSAVAGSIAHYVVGDQSVVTFFPLGTLDAGTAYRLYIEPGVEDLFLNAQPLRQQFIFTTGQSDLAATPIDDFEGDVAGTWWVPQQSGSTTGIVTDSTGAEADSGVANLLIGGSTSFRLDYGWDETASDWLIREYLAGGAPRSVLFDSTYTLQAFVFGDGSGNLFRFAVDDGVGGSEGHEVSPWYAVDWKGWRPVSWNMSSDGIGTWVGDDGMPLGNGILNGTLRFDSFQLSFAPGNPAFGRFYVDDLRLVKSVTTANEPGAETPASFRLHANYPNPFRDATTIRFDLPAPAEVTVTIYNVLGAEIASLATDRAYSAGSHELLWDSSQAASGVYFCRIIAGSASASRKLLLVR